MEKNDHQIAQVSNALIESRHELTTLQKKIMLFLISRVSKSDKPFQQYSLKISEFADTSNVVSPQLYSRIKQSTAELLMKVYEIQETDGILQVGMLSSAKYLDGKGTVQIRFDPALMPYILALKERFTFVPLRHVLGFRSIHSIRVYEMLRQFRGPGYFVISIYDLKYRLCVENKYVKYAAFKKYVLLQAQKELKGTDCEFTFEEFKKGRRVDRIKFSIVSPKKIELSKKETKLLNKLVKEYQLTLPQARKIILHLSPTIIQQTLYEIQTAKVNNVIKTNLGAFTVGVFKKKFEWLYEN